MMAHPFYMVGVLIIALLIVYAVTLGLGLTPAPRRRKPRYEAKPLLTPAERRALAIIEQQLPCCRIYPQVSMGAIIQPHDPADFRERQSIRGTYSQKIIDFVAEDRATGDFVAIIELDDHTHDARRDRARDAITAEAGYITIRLPNPKPAIITKLLSVHLPDRSASLKSKPR